MGIPHPPRAILVSVLLVAGLWLALHAGAASGADAPPGIAVSGWQWVGPPAEGALAADNVELRRSAPGMTRAVSAPVAVTAGQEVTLSFAYAGSQLVARAPMYNKFAALAVEVEWRDAAGQDLDAARLPQHLLPWRVVNDFFASSPTPVPVVVPMKVPAGAVQAAVHLVLETEGAGLSPAVAVSDLALAPGAQPAVGLIAFPEPSAVAPALTKAPAGGKFGENLVDNSDLEAGTDLPTGWRLEGDDSRAALLWQEGGAYSGRRCFRLTDRGPYAASFGPLKDPNVFVYGGEPSDVDPNSQYEVSARFVSNTRPAQPGEYFQSSSWQWHSDHRMMDRALINPVRLQFLDAEGKVLGGVHCYTNAYWESAVVRTPSGWVHVVGRVVQAPAGTVALRTVVALAHSYWGTLGGPLNELNCAFGTVLLDNIVVYRTQAKPPLREYPGFPTAMDANRAYKETAEHQALPFVGSTPGHRPGSVEMECQTPLPLGITLRDQPGKFVPGDQPFGLRYENLLADSRQVTVEWQIVDTHEAKKSGGMLTASLAPYQRSVVPIACPPDLPYGPYWLRFKALDDGEVVAEGESAFGILRTNPNSYDERGQDDYPFGTWCWPFFTYVRDQLPELYLEGKFMEVGGIGKQGFTTGINLNGAIAQPDNWRKDMDEQIALVRAVAAGLRKYKAHVRGLIPSFPTGWEKQQSAIKAALTYAVLALKDDVPIWTFSDEVLSGSETVEDLDKDHKPDGGLFLQWGVEGTPRHFLDSYYLVYDTIKAADPSLKVALNSACHLSGNVARLVIATGGKDKFDEFGINMFAAPQAIWPPTLAVFKEAGITRPIGLYGSNYISTVYSDPAAPNHIPLETTDALNEVKGWVRMMSDFPQITFAPQWDTGLSESSGNLTYRRHLKPAYVSYANMTCQLGAGTFIKTVAFPGGSLFVRQRSVRPGLVGVMWADDREAMVELKVGVPKVTLVDLWGNGREVATPGGVLSTTVGAEPVYLVGAKSFDPAPSLRVTMRQATADSRHPQIEVTLNNQKKEAVSGSLEVRPESAVALGTHAFTFDKLAPGASKSFVVEAHPVFPDRDEPLTLRAVATVGERSYEAVQPFRFFYAQEAVTPPKIDGNLEEWPESAPALVSDQASRLVRYGDTRDWGGPQDLSGRLWLKWDKDSLYLAARVKDSGLTVPAQAVDLWRGDSIEGMLSADANVTAQSEPLHFSLGQTAKGPVAIWYNGGKGQPREGVQPGVTVKADYADKMHSYEAAIPWPLLTASKLNLVPGKEISLHFSFNDGDGGQTRVMYWVHTVAGSDAASFGKVVLTGNAEATPPARENLIANGDFSAAPDPATGLPTGFGKDNMGPDSGSQAGIDTTAPLLSPALYIDRLRPGARGTLSGWRVPIKGDAYYVLTANVRVADAAKAGDWVKVLCYTMNEAGQGLEKARLLPVSAHTQIHYGTYIAVRAPELTSNGWHPCEAILHTPPEARWLQWSFTGDDGLGRSWVDDVSLYPLD